MPNINSQVQSDNDPNSIGSVINNPNNIFNIALSSLPEPPPPPPPPPIPTDNTTDIPTDYVITTDIPTDYVITTDIPTDYVITTDVTTDYVITTDVTTDYVITTDIPTDYYESDTDLGSPLDYEIWAASWTPPSANAISVVPLVFVGGDYVGPGTTDSSDDLVSANSYNLFKNTLLSVPEGRRAIQPRFWANIPWNYTWDNLAKLNWTLENDGLSLDGEKYLFTPWVDQTINEAKSSVNDFFQRCSADGLTFDFIVDNSMVSDGHSPNIWTLKEQPRVGDCVRPAGMTDQQWNSYGKCACGLRHYKCVDWASPSILEAIVRDDRFTTQVNPINGKTLSQDFLQRCETAYLQTQSVSGSLIYSVYGDETWYNVPFENDSEAILINLYGYSNNALPYKNILNHSATRAWNSVIYDWSNIYYRLELFKDALTSNGYGNVKISEYSQYPISASEMFYSEDPYTWQDAEKEDHPDMFASPSLYGEVTDINQWMYKLNPQTEKEKYAFYRKPSAGIVPEGYAAITQPAWLAFLLDIRRARSILRSNDSVWERFKPWIVSPDLNFAERFRYTTDSQYGNIYWKELVFHLCLGGVSSFNYFNDTASSTETLHNVLHEWRTVSLNSKARPKELNKIKVSSGVIISGGQLLKTGQYLWRITAKPSTSNRLLIFGPSAGRTDIPTEILLSDTERGAWLLTNSSELPLYVLDENSQEQSNVPLYVTELEPFRTPQMFWMKALYGGNNNDYGSGIGVSGGLSRGALNYLKTENVLPEERLYEADNSFIYNHSHELSPVTATPIQKQIEVSPGVFQNLSGCSTACQAGQPCYNSGLKTAVWFAKQMATTGEWGPGMRVDRPWPNNSSLDGCKFDYILDENGVAKPSPTIGLNADFPSDTYYSYVSDSSSFWKRTPANGGRNDLAYNYNSQGTTQLKTGHEFPILVDNINEEIIDSSDNSGKHVKNEPGCTYKYTQDCYAPIREDDGTADQVYWSFAVEGMRENKKRLERHYSINNTNNAPACIYKSTLYNDYMNEYFVNGEYKPKILHIDIEGALTNMIGYVNITYRSGPNQYGGVNSKLITNTIWERIVSYIKLMRKYVYYAKQVYGEQVRVYFYSPFPFPYYQAWAQNWYPTKSIMWGDVQNSPPATCPFCDELDIDYPGDAAYAAASTEVKKQITDRALKALQQKVYKFQNVLTKMLMFEIEDGQEDVLDLTEEMSILMPHLNRNLFIIEGLNHYPESAPHFLSQSSYANYPYAGELLHQDGNPWGEAHPKEMTDTADAQADFTRQIVRNGKEMVRTGLYDNQQFGQMFTNTIQPNCGSQLSDAPYQYWNSVSKDKGGYIKSWSSSDRVNAVEISQFPVTTTDPAHKPGERKIQFRNNVKNYNNRSFMKHFPKINITNDELNKYTFAMSNAVNSEVLFSWNPSFSYLSMHTGRPITVPSNFNEQYRPCAQGEIAPGADPQNNPCRDIQANPYVKPYKIDGDFSLRNNNYLSFGCFGGEGCVNYCYYDGTQYAGGDNVNYTLTTSMKIRKWLYELAIEYASYDDGVAIPYHDFTNDNYWYGYYGAKANFDPFFTGPIPATPAISTANFDNTRWPYSQYSETAKRVRALGIILACRKENSLYKFYKNNTVTNNKDWPQPAANFNVDRRPGVAITTSVAGGTGRPYLLNWSSDTTTATQYWKQCLDGEGNIIFGLGLQKYLDDYLTWNYERGLRRFLLWSPAGTMHYINPQGNLYSAYTSAVTSAMENKIYEKFQLNSDGTYTVVERFVNPSESCWKNVESIRNMPSGGTLRIPSLEEAENIPYCTDPDYSGVGPCFDPEGRKNEWFTCLGEWIANHPDADVGLYIGYTIPTLNGIPESKNITIAGAAGTSNFLQNTSGEGVRGWQVPDPENNQAHADFLTEELQPWMDIGINFLGFDVGQGMFNYNNGGTTSWGANHASRTPVGNYKEWLQTTWPQIKTVIAEALPLDDQTTFAPVVDEFNNVIAGRTVPRKSMFKIDTSTAVCKGTLVQDIQSGQDPSNRVYSDSCWENKGRERYRKLDPNGASRPNTSDFNYSPGAYQYSPYLIAVNGWLNSGEWNIGLHNPSNNWTTHGGLDPNKMLCWYRGNTEIGAFFESFYQLSDSLLKKYRDNFPTEKDANGWQTYNNLWQLVPAWHDRGLATPTTSPISENTITTCFGTCSTTFPTTASLELWDGRTIERDSEFYNRVRNEMYISIKNYIDRGYTFWCSTSAWSFQLIKDVHADILYYIKSVEIDTNPFPQDTSPQDQTETQLNNLRIARQYSPSRATSFDESANNIINPSTDS